MYDSKYFNSKQRMGLDIPFKIREDGVKTVYSENLLRFRWTFIVFCTTDRGLILLFSLETKVLHIFILTLAHPGQTLPASPTPI